MGVNENACILVVLGYLSSPWEHKVVTHEWVETLVEEIDKEGKQLGKAQADMDKMLA